MKILNRYLLKQHALPFVFALAAMTGIMLLNQIARRLEDLVGKGLPWYVIVEFFALTIPFIVAMTLSMAVLVSVLYTISNMTSDREITALRAGGVSLGQVLRPLLLAGTVVALVALAFGDQVLPRTNHRLRSLMTDIYRTKPTFSLKEHVINEVQRGRLALRTAQIDQSTYRMKDVTVYDLADRSRNRIVYADSGALAFAPNQQDLQLTLYDGTINEFDRDDARTFQHTAFNRQIVLVRNVGSEFMRRENDDYRGDREMGICQLEEVVRSSRREGWMAERRAEGARRNGLRALVGLAPLPVDTANPPGDPGFYCGKLAKVIPWILPAELRAQLPQHADDSLPRVLFDRFNEPARDAYLSGVAPKQHLNEVRVLRDRARNARIRESVYLVELYKKYAIPAACIVFILIGVPIAMRFPRGGVGLVVGVSLVVFTIYYIGLIAGESLANRLLVTPFWAMWTPNLVMSAVGVAALWWVRREGTAFQRGRSARGLRHWWRSGLGIRRPDPGPRTPDPGAA